MLSHCRINSAIDTEISRVGGVLSDAIPAELLGVWSNDNTTPFAGKTLVITPDGRGLLTGGTGFGAPFRWRYIAPTGALRGTMLMPKDEHDPGKPVVTIELRLDTSKTVLAVTSYKAIVEEMGSERELIKERFTRKAAEIPEDLNKMIR